MCRVQLPINKNGCVSRNCIVLLFSFLVTLVASTGYARNTKKSQQKRQTFFSKRDNSKRQSKPFTIPLKKVKAADAPRFKITSVTDKEKEIDYFRVTPESVLKKRRKVNKPKSGITPVAEIKNIAAQPIKPAETESVIIVRETAAEQSSDTAASSENITAAAEILGIIAKSDGITLDGIMAVSDLSFGELSEILADLEINGTISCGAGGIYRAEKEK